MRCDNRSARKKEDATPDAVAFLIAVRRAQCGDGEAKLILLARFKPLCLHCVHEAHRRLLDEDLESLLAAVTYEFLVLLNEFDAGRGIPFEGFLKAMLPWRVLEWARKEGRCHRHETPFCKMRRDESDMDAALEDADRLALSYGVPATEPPDEKVDWALFWQQAAPTLPKRQRQAMELIQQGFSQREIAAQMGISEVAVHKLKEKACKRLKKLL